MTIKNTLNEISHEIKIFNFNYREYINQFTHKNLLIIIKANIKGLN